jgi:CDP-glucose 4,6-dehydratase
MNWLGKRVLVTGHTGFKGGWLALDLAMKGAKVIGLALEPNTKPSLFRAAQLDSVVDSRIGDIRDFDRVLAILSETKPEIVFHLAAQPLVRRSYREPLETFDTNVLGTTKILEAIRKVGSVSAVVVVTTDKCYENKEWYWGYRETDQLGGHDPYSASKACAEIVVSAYRSSFFTGKGSAGHPTALASARAGNVIGGGDWAEDRLIPDMVRAFQQMKPVTIRNPGSVRPWQHVLEPVEAYIELAAKLSEEPLKFASAWNFGPELSDAIPVAEIVKTFASFWGDGATWEVDSAPQVHETTFLRLDCSKAALELGWQPTLNIEDSLRLTAQWYQEFGRGSDMSKFTANQILEYSRIRESKQKVIATQ